MKQIADYGHDTAENILWQPEEQALYWLDIPAGKLFRSQFQPENFSSACILEMDEAIGGFVFFRSATLGATGFLLFASAGRIYSWEYGSQGRERPCLYHKVEGELVPNRFNDVFAMPGSLIAKNGGSVLCGTMPSAGCTDSRLLLFDVAEKKITVVQQGLKLANGMGLSPQKDFFYLADTRDFVIYRFAVNNGGIDWASRQRWIEFGERPGRPDGLCLDSAGQLWVAETGAGMVSCFGADGREAGRFELPTPKITSCCFGGRMQQTLFVSTQGGTGEAGQAAGGIFAHNFCGQPEPLL